MFAVIAAFGIFAAAGVASFWITAQRHRKIRKIQQEEQRRRAELFKRRLEEPIPVRIPEVEVRRDSPGASGSAGLGQ
jgi:hypothetical protein